MPELPLFYRSVEPLNSVEHRQHLIASQASPYSFAERAHLLPAVVDEFAVAARDLPILFAPTGKHFSTVFLCGLKAGSNVFIGADGNWHGAYVPAYLRRYPFMLGEREGADPVICIDASYPAFVTEGEGVRLFDDEGAPSTAMTDMIRLVTDFASAARHTEAFCLKLEELDLLKSISIDVKLGSDGGSASIHGLSVIDEQKLNALADEPYAELRRLGYIGAIYAHLFSIGATEKLAARLAQNA